MNIGLILLEETPGKLLHGEAGLTGILNLDQQFIIQFGFHLFATLLLVLFLAKMLYQPVRKFLLDRKERIARQLEDAEEAQESAHATKAEYEAKLADIAVERSQILDEARNKARETEEQIIGDARKEADAIITRARLQVAREREHAADEMKRQTVEIASLIAEQFLTKAIDRQAQDKLLDEVVAGLGDLSWSA